MNQASNFKYNYLNIKGQVKRRDIFTIFQNFARKDSVANKNFKTLNFLILIINDMIIENRCKKLD